MSDQVKISLNLATGAIDIEAPASVLNSVFDRLESFLPKLSVEQKRNPADNIQENEPNVDNDRADGESTEKRRDRRSGKNTGTPRSAAKKPEVYKLADIQLSPEERKDLKEFYATKKPVSQSDQVLVIMYWLKEKKKLDKLTMDEIFTGLKTVEAQIPKRISSVLSNLAIEDYIIKENHKSMLHHTGEDYVLLKLPKQIGTNK